MPALTTKRLPRDSSRVLLEAASLVEEHHPRFNHEISLRVDRLIQLAELLQQEGH